MRRASQHCRCAGEQHREPCIYQLEALIIKYTSATLTCLRGGTLEPYLCRGLWGGGIEVSWDDFGARVQVDVLPPISAPVPPTLVVGRYFDLGAAEHARE